MTWPGTPEMQALIDEVNLRHQRAKRAYARSHWAALTLAGLCLGAVPVLTAATDNPWLALLLVPATIVPLLFQEAGFRYIACKYGLDR